MGTKETPDDEAVIWKLEEDGPEPEDGDDTFYSITGNFNDWQDDRMTPGEAAGAFTYLLEVPESGALEFRILKEDDEKQVIAPATPDCSRKTEAILGPTEGLTNKWKLTAEPGKEIQVLFFCKGGFMSI